MSNEHKQQQQQHIITQHRKINSLKNAITQHRTTTKHNNTNNPSSNNNVYIKHKHPKNINSTIKHILHSTTSKHDSTPKQITINIINTLIESKPTHLVTIFKDHMITDFIDEFLRREYLINESFERLPKFANYYKNYLTFFCKPTFSNFYCNHIVQSFGEAKAEIYYNNNYGKNSKQKKKSNIKKEGVKPLFSSTIKEEIENNNTLMSFTLCAEKDKWENNDHTISLSVDNSKMVKQISNNKGKCGSRNSNKQNMNGNLCYQECMTFHSNAICKKTSTESSLASIIDMFTQPQSNNNNNNKMKSKLNTQDNNNICGNHKQRSRNLPTAERLQISKTQTIPSNTHTATNNDINHQISSTNHQQTTNPSINNTHTLKDKQQRYTIYTNPPHIQTNLRYNPTKKFPTNFNQRNQLTIQTQCKNIPFTTRNKSNELNSATLTVHTLQSSSRHNNYTNNKKLLNTNMNLKNKFKLSSNPPLHLKTMSSNFQSSINTYNKIIRQTTNALSSSKTKKSLNKISFNSNNRHLPTSPGATRSTNTNKDLFPSTNINLDNIMKLTLKLYQPKDNMHSTTKIHHVRCNSSTNNRETLSTPTINNFNININNHICFSNNYSNNSNSNNSVKSNGNLRLDANKMKNIGENFNRNSKKDSSAFRTHTEGGSCGKKGGHVITLGSPRTKKGSGYLVSVRGSHVRRFSNGVALEKKKTSKFVTTRKNGNDAQKGGDGSKVVISYKKGDGSGKN